MENEDIRKVLTYWGHSGQIERYQFSIISENLKSALVFIIFILSAAACGFIWGWTIGIN